MLESILYIHVGYIPLYRRFDKVTVQKECPICFKEVKAKDEMTLNHNLREHLAKHSWKTKNRASFFAALKRS
jgi:hypothetical protein